MVYFIHPIINRNENAINTVNQIVDIIYNNSIKIFLFVINKNVYNNIINLFEYVCQNKYYIYLFYPKIISCSDYFHNNIYECIHPTDNIMILMLNQQMFDKMDYNYMRDIIGKDNIIDKKVLPIIPTISFIDHLYYKNCPIWILKLCNVKYPLSHDNNSDFLKSSDIFLKYKHKIPDYIIKPNDLFFWKKLYNNKLYPNDINNIDDFYYFERIYLECNDNNVENIKEKYSLPKWISTVSDVHKYIFVFLHVKNKDGDNYEQMKDYITNKIKCLYFFDQIVNQQYLS